MYQIFNGLDHLRRGERRDTNLDRLFHQQQGQLAKAIQFYQTNYYDVNLTNNPLLRLCYTFAYGNGSPYDYYRQAYASLEHITTGVGITTTETQGTATRDCFYGKDTLTILVSELRKENQQAVLNETPWQQLTPLRFLRIPFICSPFERPDRAKGLAFDENYCLVGVDIPTFAMMVRGWEIDNAKKPANQQQRIEHFLGQWLYPSLMPSQADGITRRALVMGQDTDEWKLAKKPSVFNMPDFTKEMTGHINTLLSSASETQLNWYGILDMVPSFMEGNMSKALPEVATTFTQSTQWVSLAALVETGILCETYVPNPPDSGNLLRAWRRYDRHLRNARWLSKCPEDIPRIAIQSAYDLFVQQLPDV